MRGSACRSHAAYHIGAVFGGALRVEGSFLAGDPLNNQPRIFID